MNISINKVMAAMGVLSIVVLAQTATVSAQTTDLRDNEIKVIAGGDISNDALEILTKKAEPKPEPQPVAPTPKEYVVVDKDNLSKIATAQNTTWVRLWQKNTNIEHPDRIKVGDKLVIPTADEQLADRPLPVEPVQAVISPVAPIAPQRTAPAPNAAKKAPTAAPRRGAVSGNTYEPGQCTWYVKNRRPDLPNNLGNADTWYARARAQGMAVGTTPVAGAAAPRKVGMHVVYVEAVHSDGTITISEMNYNYVPYSTRTKIASASDYYYIY